MKFNRSSRLPRLLLAGAGALALCALGAAPSQGCGPLPGGGAGGAEGGTTPPVCGDGIISGMEQCDGTSLNQTCAAPGGTLRCDPRTCTLDTRQCTRAVCGDGRIEGNEQCEGTNVQGATCGGGLVGTVKCNARFCELDDSDCKPATCGNGRRDEEECDGQDLGGATCQSIYDSSSTGTLRCAANCKYDTRFCIERPGTCGDGIVQEPYETCDGDTPCQEFAVREGRPADYYLPGFVPCNRMLCRRDGGAVAQYCQVNPAHCGNGIIEPLYGETCDGANIGLATCLAGGFLFGVPRCTTSCQIHYFSGCTGGCVAAGRGTYCQ